MAASEPSTLTALPEAVRTRLVALLPPLLRDCRSLVALAWDPQLVERSQATMEELLTLLSGVDAPGLLSTVRELYAYLAGVRMRKPGEAYAQEFGERVERLAALLDQFVPQAVDDARWIDLYSADGLVPAGVEHAFGLSGFLVRGFSDAQAWADAVARKPAAALLVEAPLVAKACEALDALARQVPASGSTVIVGYGGGANSRLQALLGGAELYFDRLDDPTLAPRVVELIERPHEDPYRVLVVDDDASMRLYLKLVLEQAGMRVECAEADKVVGAIGTFEPDLLLVDLYMPGIDGMSLTMELRLQPELAMLPIVFLSGEQGDETRFQAIQLGGDDFLTKPVRPRILIAAVRSRIKRARSVRRQLPTPASVNAPLRSGQLRRGDFLSQLGEALRNPRGSWQVLMAVKLDQADKLDDKLGLAGAFELEQQVAARMASVLDAEDAYTLWLEFGFGILAARDSSEEIVALAQALCQAVAGQPFDVLGTETALTIAVGIALPPAPGQGSDPDRWFASAYAAQAIAHRLGGNRHDGVLNREHGNTPPERVLMIREWVKEAVTGENIIVEFQPMLPLRGDPDGLYALVAKLRDYRAPLAGVYRNEFIGAARDAGAMALIDRVGLFHAFEAIDEQRQRGRATRVLVPMDLASFDHAQLLWLVAELRRRKAHANGLIIEVDAELLLERPALVAIVQRLKESGICISLSEPSGSMTRIERLNALPADLLRLPFSAVNGVSAKAFAELLAPWRAAGRQIIIDRVEDINAVSQMWSLGIGYLQGDALAAAGPRLDYDFNQGGL
jgi:CheY-like chemotaxis protein/EAL domain-containing protein (putative c-di-GMP-specific phosphodiesterase class I)